MDCIITDGARNYGNRMASMLPLFREKPTSEMTPREYILYKKYNNKEFLLIDKDKLVRGRVYYRSYSSKIEYVNKKDVWAYCIYL